MSEFENRLKTMSDETLDQCIAGVRETLTLLNIERRERNQEKFKQRKERRSWAEKEGVTKKNTLYSQMGAGANADTLASYQKVIASMLSPEEFMFIEWKGWVYRQYDLRHADDEAELEGLPRAWYNSLPLK